MTRPPRLIKQITRHPNQVCAGMRRFDFAERIARRRWRDPLAYAVFDQVEAAHAGLRRAGLQIKRTFLHIVGCLLSITTIRSKMQ